MFNLKGGEKQSSGNTKKGEAGGKRPSISLDRIVVEGMRAGSHQSFEVVFHTFYYRVRNFLLSMTKDMDVAEELTQQVFVSLWENRSLIDPGKNFNSYIYSVAKNAALGYFRTRTLHTEIENRIFEKNPVVTADSEMLAREAQYLVELTVGNMPRQRKQIYELSQLHNKSNHEIAEELNITKKAVEKHLRLAFSDIRSVLQRFISLMVL